MKGFRADTAWLFILRVRTFAHINVIPNWPSASYKVKVKIVQSCSTLWDSMAYIVHEILQARILEWVAFPFSRGSSQSRDGTQVSHIAGKFFTSWDTREAPKQLYFNKNKWFFFFRNESPPLMFLFRLCKDKLRLAGTWNKVLKNAKYMLLHTLYENDMKEG